MSTTALDYEVIPSKHWVEGDEEGWTFPELRATGRHNGVPVRLRCPMFDTSDETVALAKDLIAEHLSGDQPGGEQPPS